MKRLLRLAIISFGIFAVLIVGTGVALAATVAATGFVVVQVQEKGDGGVSFTAPVPAALIDAGLGIARLTVADELDEASQQLEPYEPMIRELLDELDQAGTFTLVSVKTDDETVRVRKDKRHLIVDVDAEDAKVHVSLPLSLAERALNALSL